ncbi:MAG: copper-binding protein [Marinosulfonomonas sp.]|nr:copper chaperone PCu(A)C [Marinosulfonomonas sp.]PHQ98848.1 MAG: copper-binding protein [Marinosulfonomonas sp.]
MLLRRTFMVAAAACAFALPTFAGEMGIMIKDPYSRAAGPNAKTGAAFFGIINHTGQDDRLIAASSDIAKRVELHTHIETADGIMQMREVKDGFPVEAGGMHMLARGGDHVMFMGLTRPMVQGEMVTVTLTFEVAGDIIVEIPVDLERKPAAGGMAMDHKMPSN